MHGNGRSIPRLSVRDLIPASRLAAIDGVFYASEPAVCDGDDVYEVDLTGEDLQSADDLDIEHAFLRYVVQDAGDKSKIEDLISYARKNYWLGGKNIHVELDVGKTILNRQTKLVLHNSKPRNSTNSNTPPNKSKPFKKTDFTLEEWPHVSRNKLLITKGNDEWELAPWMRSKNKQFNPNFLEPIETAKYAPATPVAPHERSYYWKRNAPHHRLLNPVQLPTHRRVFASVPTGCADPPRPQLRIGRWPGDLQYRQLLRFQTPPPPPPPPPPRPTLTPLTYYRSRNRLTTTAGKRDSFKCKNTMLQCTRHSDNLSFSPENNNVKDLMMAREGRSNHSKVNLVNDECIEKIISTFGKH